MKMHQDWVNIPEKNKHELEHILSLLENEFEFSAAILYGYYAGGRMRSEMGGYELLLLTKDEPTKEGWELEESVKRKYPTESRVQKKLHIEIVSIKAVIDTNASSWFLWNVLMEGTIIYNNGSFHNELISTQFAHVDAYGFVRKHYKYFFENGSTMLFDAEMLWCTGKSALAAILISYAAQFLLRAEETVFYGNFIHTSNLHKSFCRARNYSKRLVREFKLGRQHNTSLFEQLEGFRNAPQNCPDFELPEPIFYNIFHRLQTLQEIIRESCERHLFYLKHGKSKRQMTKEEYEAINVLSTGKTTTWDNMDENSDDMMDNIIYKEDVKRFLEKLQQEAHWMYVLMHHSSESEIRILYESEKKIALEQISVSEFEKQYDWFESEIPITIHCYTYHFKDDNILDYEAVGEFEIMYTTELECSLVLEMAPHILSYICLQAIKNGNPFTINDTTIEKYGFTLDDSELLQDKVADINNRLMKEFTADYDSLKKIVEQKYQ